MNNGSVHLWLLLVPLIICFFQTLCHAIPTSQLSPSELEQCEKLRNISVTVFPNILGNSANFTVDTHIETNTDYFHLLIENQTIPKLCPNFVVIGNELSVFQLVNNSIEDILPGAFNITPTLALVRIVLNPLAMVRSHVFNVLQVKEIDLSHNRIMSIDPEAFDNITSLEIINLSNNHLKELNPRWFFNSPHVYKVEIVFNDITTIPPAAFRHLTKERPLKLRLSANRITDIHPDALSGHNHIDYFIINGNQIKVLPPELFVNRTIANLQVATNKLGCFPEVLYGSVQKSLVFIDNVGFDCLCLQRVKEFVETNSIEVIYPSIICENRTMEANIVYNYNKTYEIPLLPPAIDVVVSPDMIQN